MIEFPGQDGAPIAVNPGAIWHVRAASGDQTAIYSATGAALFVNEAYADVVRKLREFRSSGTDRSGTLKLEVATTWLDQPICATYGQAWRELVTTPVRRWRDFRFSPPGRRSLPGPAG